MELDELIDLDVVEIVLYGGVQLVFGESIHAETGEIRSRVVADVAGSTLRSVITEQVQMARSVLHTDGAHAYEAIGVDMAGHFAVDHSAGQYVIPGSNGTNKAENYFSQLKRSIDGTHHHVSVEHLGRYLAEFDFRYSTHDDTDTARVNTLMGRVGGRRLAYRVSSAGAN